MVSIHTSAYQDMITLLKKRRESLNISQRALAKMLNVSQSYISKVETFELRLDVIDYFRFASTLEMDLTPIIKMLGKHIPFYKHSTK